MGYKSKGLTLIEVLVVITVMSVLAGSLYIVFKSGMDAWSKSDTRLDIYQNARVVLDQVSRELPGAFVGGGAKFAGTDGGAGATDEIAFATEFGTSVYQLKYWVDTSGGSSIFKREYEENPDFSAGSFTYTAVAFNDATDNARISDMQLIYWDGNSSSWTTDGSWTDTTRLPESVKITLTFTDSSSNTYKFETKVYLPNSE